MSKPIEKVCIFAPATLMWNGLRALLQAENYETSLADPDVESVQLNGQAYRNAIFILGSNQSAEQAVKKAQGVIQRRTGNPVILVLNRASQAAALSAIEAGVEGIIVEDDSPQNLVTCLREVARGRKWISQSAIHSALDKALGRRSSIFSKLTAREREIADMTAAGKTTATVAGDLSVAPGTVKVHLHNIYKKLDIPGRSELVRLVLEEKARA